MFFRVSDQKRSEARFFHSTVAQRRPNVLQLLRADGRIFRSSPRAHSRSHGWRLTAPDGRMSVPTLFQVMFLERLLGPPTMSPAQQIWVHFPLRHTETSDLQNHRFSRGDPVTHRRTLSWFRSQRKILLMSTSLKNTNNVASLLLLQGSQHPFNGLNLSVPNGLLVQFRQEVAEGGLRPVGTDVSVPDRKCLRCVCASRRVLAAPGGVGETVLSSAWSRNSSSAPGLVPL